MTVKSGAAATSLRLSPRAAEVGGVSFSSSEPGARGVREFQSAGPAKPRYWTWANLMRRAFELDVLACPRCGGRMRLIATIEDPRVVHRILAHLGLPTEGPAACPARPPPPDRSADLFSDMPA